LIRKVELTSPHANCMNKAVVTS